MPGAIRGDLKAAKIAYKILKTPKDKQQHNQKNPPEHLVKQWFKDSSTAQ